jgi:L-iditol 2-dehydrogenase
MALLLIHALRARGCRVLVAGRSYENLETAKKAGATETFSSLDEDISAAVRNATDGRGADAVFEAVGRPETWQQSLSMVRKGGRVCLFGGCASGTMVPVDAHRVHYEQLSLHGVFHHTPKYFKAAVDLLASGQVAVELLIRQRIDLDEIPDFFETNAERSISKAAVIP